MEFYIFRKSLLYCILLGLIGACIPIKQVVLKRDLKILLSKSEIFNDQITGFVLYDPETAEIIYSIHGDDYFNPASNIKLLTTLAVLQNYKDSIPTFLRYPNEDTVIIEPLGDPTFLHPDFPNPRWFDMFSGQKISIHYPMFDLKKFGPGWAWDDYPYYYQPERSLMPLYGNVVKIGWTDSLRVSPLFFKDYVQVHPYPSSLRQPREEYFNLFHYDIPSDTSKVVDIPFITGKELTQILLKNRFEGDFSTLDYNILSQGDTLYNASTLHALAVMMKRSDNFLAEQLLINKAIQLGDHNTDQLRWNLKRIWSLPDQTQWVDGSGLSRYNLITPNSLVKVLHLIYQQASWQMIQTIFPEGGVSGTIKDWYGGNPSYLYAKTGTFRNNHCLSGYLVTNSGKTLIFSMMNNHYTRPVAEIKVAMQEVLEVIRDEY